MRFPGRCEEEQGANVARARVERKEVQEQEMETRSYDALHEGIWF